MASESVGVCLFKRNQARDFILISTYDNLQHMQIKGAGLSLQCCLSSLWFYLLIGKEISVTAQCTCKIVTCPPCPVTMLQLLLTYNYLQFLSHDLVLVPASTQYPQ